MQKNVEISCCLAVAVPYSFNLDYVGNFSSAWVILLNDEMINVTTLAEVTKKYASSGKIDLTLNMLMDRVFIYSSLDDTYILTGHSRARVFLCFFLLLYCFFHVYLVTNS